MDLSSHQLEILLSVFVVLGSAFIAFACDLLRGTNEQLRELNVELRVRLEEERKAREMLLDGYRLKTENKDHVVRESFAPAAGGPLAGGAQPRREDRQRRLTPEVLAAFERATQVAMKQRRGQAAAETDPVHAPRTEEAIEDLVEERNEIQAAAPVALGLARVRAAAVTSSCTENSPLKNGHRSMNPLAEPAAQYHVRPQVATESGRASVFAATDCAGAFVPELPVGLHDGFVLRRLLELGQPVSGLVVSIKVTVQQNEGRPIDTVLAEVRSLVESLIGPRDFAAQWAEEVYVLVCPRLRGPVAQRQLSEVAERLWRFQLHSLGRLSVLSSCGGVEVCDESLKEALASAMERMNETWRGRKMLSMDGRSRASTKTLRPTMERAQIGLELLESLPNFQE
jgi:hypothetical protein